MTGGFVPQPPAIHGLALRAKGWFWNGRPLSRMFHSPNFPTDCEYRSAKEVGKSGEGDAVSLRHDPRPTFPTYGQPRIQSLTEGHP
jgi:hypothetical protein